MKVHRRRSTICQALTYWPEGCSVATNVHLTPDLERFARHCVESGRYNNVSEVVRSALRMLQDAETQRERFMAMLDKAEAEGERDGFFEIDEVVEELDRIIDDAERSRG